MMSIKHWCVAAALLVNATACLEAPPEDARSSGAPQPGGGDPPPAVEGWNVASGDAQLGQGPGEASITADCAFIEWCNRPASISPDIGTVCRVRTGCAFPPSGATVTECTNDALAVCGAITQPAFICKQGAACP